MPEIDDIHGAAVGSDLTDGRAASQMFRIALLRSALTGAPSAAMAAFNSYARGFPPGTSRGRVLHAAAQLLEKHYRSEYYYKNILANRLLLGRTQRHDSALLMEVRLESTVLDALLVSEVATAYEIKSELDSPSKLKAQIASYKRVAPEVVLVTHWRLADRYLELLGEDRHVGLMALDSRGALRRVRQQGRDYSQLDTVAMFKTLRQEEYVRIAWRWWGEKPSAPSALLYEHCLSAALEMPKADFEREHTRELRTRALRFGSGIRDPRLSDIRSLCVQLNPTRAQVERLIGWVEERIDVLPLRQGQAV